MIELKERFDLINLLASHNQAKSYLEIGVQDKSNNFNRIQIPFKVGVDPDQNAQATYVMGSDDFFKSNTVNFDLIFIDGLHHAEQVKRDFENSLKFLNPKGFIVLHDGLPDAEEFTSVPRQTKKWYGDVYKFIMIMHNYHGIDYRVVKFDCGCTVAWKTSAFESVSKIPDHLATSVTWDYFVKNRSNLPLVDPEPKRVMDSILSSYKRTMPLAPEPTEEQKPIKNFIMEKEEREKKAAVDLDQASKVLQALERLEPKIDMLLDVFSNYKEFKGLDSAPIQDSINPLPFLNKSTTINSSSPFVGGILSKHKKESSAADDKIEAHTPLSIPKAVMVPCLPKYILGLDSDAAPLDPGSTTTQVIKDDLEVIDQNIKEDVKSMTKNSHEDTFF